MAGNRAHDPKLHSITHPAPAGKVLKVALKRLQNNVITLNCNEKMSLLKDGDLEPEGVAENASHRKGSGRVAEA